MKNLILLVSVLSLAVVANASDSKKANRKPAGVSGEVSYIGPFTADSKTAEIEITGEAADQIYADMKAVTPTASNKMNGRSVVCTAKNPPVNAHGHCEIYFDDVTTGSVQVNTN
jgi:hypothetical protein